MVQPEPQPSWGHARVRRALTAKGHSMSHPAPGIPTGRPTPPRQWADVLFQNHGSVILLGAFTPQAALWIDRHVGYEADQWIGGWLACEPRYAGPIVQAMHSDGLVVAEAGNVH